MKHQQPINNYLLASAAILVAATSGLGTLMYQATMAPVKKPAVANVAANVVEDPYEGWHQSPDEIRRRMDDLSDTQINILLVGCAKTQTALATDEEKFICQQAGEQEAMRGMNR
jgi:hypothetical protein